MDQKQAQAEAPAFDRRTLLSLAAFALGSGALPAFAAGKPDGAGSPGSMPSRCAA